jgi:Flp pilus assembly protein TadG
LHNEEGANLVEMALTLPILLAFVFGLMEVCLAFYVHEYISELAREGTRYGAVHGTTCVTSPGAVPCTVTAAQVGAYVVGLGWPNLGGGTVSVDTVTAHMYPDGSEAPGKRVQVKVTYAFPYKIPWVTSTTLTMSSSSVMTIIQ